MKKTLFALLGLTVLTFLAACRKKSDNKPVSKTYVWEKEGFGSEFTITLNDDNTYNYYEGALSSYMGFGEWWVHDGILTLRENTGYGFVFNFNISNGKLLFIRSSSDKFIYCNVEDGDCFNLKKQEE